MIRRWVVYLLILALAVVFYILFIGYFSYFTLIFVTVFPLFSLLLSLPAMWSVQVALEAERLQQERGTMVAVAVGLHSTLRLPVYRGRLVLQMKNRMTGETEQRVLRMPVYGRGIRSKQVFQLTHCGVVQWTVKRMWVYDALGLFAIPRWTKSIASVVSTPKSYETAVDPELLESVRREGNGWEEDSANMEIRQYRPPDSPRLVHWKLSARFDDLMVRADDSGEGQGMPRLYPVWDQDAEVTDRMLDRLTSLSNFLSDRQLPHEICWEDGQEVCRVRIRADEDLPSALPQLLSIPLPERRNDLIAGVEAQGIAVDAQSIRRMEDGSLLEESRQ